MRITKPMKKLILPVLLAIILIGCNNPKEVERPPNIIYFLADDLGYGEIGVQGQKIIQTPNIDALAKSGMRFTQHYSGAPVCAPARYMFLTGKHSGHAFIRGNDEWNERGDVWDYAKASADPGLPYPCCLASKAANRRRSFSVNVAANSRIRSSLSASSLLATVIAIRGNLHRIQIHGIQYTR